jgi:hypothetical protein
MRHPRQGLAKLQRLTMFANDLQWDWCMLPLLEELTLGSHCNIGDLEHESGTLGIHTLQMDCFSTILVPGYVRHRNFSSLLQRTPRLRTLRLTICYKIYDEDNEGRPIGLLAAWEERGFDVLVTALAAVAPVLEELSIEEGRTDPFTGVPGWLAHTLPLSTLTNFQHLKILEISQEALLGREPAQGTMRLVQDFLPSSLKVLRIT